MRAFVALDLPEAHIEPLVRVQSGLTVGRLVAEENLHLTLAFLGEISDQEAYAVAEALASVPLPGVELSLSGLDLIGGRKPGVLFAGASGEGLERLQGKVARAVREAGVALARERFRPHVTLARFGKVMTARDEKTLGEFLALNSRFSAPVARATAITLYRSHLTEDGPIYEPLAEVDLAR